MTMSWTNVDKRQNFQYVTHIAWKIKNGKLGRMLRDATYTGITPEFWGSLDAVAGPETWHMQGLTNCGKGQPGQGAPVSHGASPCRSRGVQVGPNGRGPPPAGALRVRCVQSTATMQRHAYCAS